MCTVNIVNNIIRNGKNSSPCEQYFFNNIKITYIYRYFSFKHLISSIFEFEMSVKKSSIFVDERINFSTKQCIIIVKLIH